MAYAGKFLKRIVINLPPTEDNEINMIHSYVQNHISYVGSHKSFLKHYSHLEKKFKIYKICIFILIQI